VDIHGDWMNDCDKCGKQLTEEEENECWFCGGLYCDNCIGDHECEEDNEVLG